MAPCQLRPRPLGKGVRDLLGVGFLLALFLQSACATGVPGGRLVAGHPSTSWMPWTPPARMALPRERGLEVATVYAVDFLEAGAVVTRPVPIPTAEFQQALQRLSREVSLGSTTPRQAAHELLSLLPPPEVETVEGRGDWTLEAYRGQAYTLVPAKQEGPGRLTPVTDEALLRHYLQWCERQGGGDCLGLLDDGPWLRTEDRRTLALALAFGSVLEETRTALASELLSVQALVSMVVWTVALYCMLWVVPEPTTKALAASLTVLLLSYLGLQTLYSLMDGWALLADAAHHASTFEELRSAGSRFGRVLGEEAARALILAVAALTGRTLGDVAARVKTLPGARLAGAQWQAQGGAAALAPEVVAEAAWAQETALVRAVTSVETVATSPQGPLAVVLLKQGTGGGAQSAPGGRSAQTIQQHRGGNRQVELSDGQRWHLPRGTSVADIPAEDAVGDMLQEAVTRAAREWGPHRLSDPEKEAIQEALNKGRYWLARLLEREARGRYVHETVKAQFKRFYRFNHQGADVIDPATGRKYELLSGTESNLARHGRRMAGEFYRMLTF